MSWQPPHTAVNVFLPGPSGKSGCWARAGNTEHSSAAAVADNSDLVDIKFSLGMRLRGGAFSTGSLAAAPRCRQAGHAKVNRRPPAGMILAAWAAGPFGPRSADR